MATIIRLARFGRKKRPFYRIAVADSRFPRDGRNIEFIGYYDPLSDPVALGIKRDKALGWRGEGATPSASVKRIFSSQG
ncbi:MAG: 30S ribosomal protein S16, partial [bacterium]|nr:30S ribosomal protein S16 [bacterium]